MSHACGTYIYLSQQFWWRKISSARLLRFLRPSQDLWRKCNFWPSGLESTPRPRESSALLCQLSYRGRCRDHGHEFSIYGVVKPIKWRVYSETLWHFHSTAYCKSTILMKENLECSVTSYFRNRSRDSGVTWNF